MSRGKIGRGEVAVEAILAGAEWHSYADLVGRWYTPPLSSATATAPESINEVERRIGRTLPARLRE